MITTLRRAAFLATALLVTGCADQAPTAVPSAAPSAVASMAAGSRPTTTASPELLARMNAELARVRTVQARSGPAFDLLSRVWKAGKAEHKKDSPVLVCNPLAYAADVKIVGPQGGVLVVGPHRLAIPAGALREPTVITAEAPVSLARELRFSPHGTQFAVAPTMTMSYKGCVVPSGFESAVAYVDEGLDVLEWPKATDRRNGEVTSYIWHFSRYSTARRRSSYATSW